MKRYSSPLHAFRTIWIEEGPRAFTRGLSVRLLYITPSAAVSFAFYEYFKTVFLAWRSGASFSSWTKARRREHLQHEQAASVDASQATVADDDDDDDDSTSLSIFHPLAPLVAGAMARLVGTACRTPFDIIKARLQVWFLSERSSKRLWLTAACFDIACTCWLACLLATHLQIQGSLKERKYSGTFDAFRKVWCLSTGRASRALVAERHLCLAVSVLAGHSARGIQGPLDRVCQQRAARCAVCVDLLFFVRVLQGTYG